MPDTGVGTSGDGEREIVCPHCDGTGKGPQSGQWGAVLTAYGVLPAECQNCFGTGRVTVESGGRSRTEEDR